MFGSRLWLEAQWPDLAAHHACWRCNTLATALPLHSIMLHLLSGSCALSLCSMSDSPMTFLAEQT